MQKSFYLDSLYTGSYCNNRIMPAPVWAICSHVTRVSLLTPVARHSAYSADCNHSRVYWASGNLPRLQNSSITPVHAEFTQYLQEIHRAGMCPD